MTAPTSIVDADGHVLEPPDGMQRFAPAKFRDRIWHIEVKTDGSEWLHFNGGSRPAYGLALAGIIIGGIFTLLFIAYIVFIIIFFAAVASSVPLR